MLYLEILEKTDIQGIDHGWTHLDLFLSDERQSCHKNVIENFPE